MKLCDMLPICGRILLDISEKLVELVAVREPQPVEIARSVVIGLEEVLGSAAYHLKAVVKRVVTYYAVDRAAADVEALFPKIRLVEFAGKIALENAADEHAAVVRRHPFERSVEAGVEHEPVRNVARKHIVVKHCRLPNDRPIFHAAVHDAELAAHFRRRVHIERAYEERISHSAPRVP